MWETLLAVECGSEVKVVTAGGERGSVWDACWRGAGWACP